MLRITAYAAILLLIWQSRNFLYDLILYHVERYDYIAYYYWEHNGNRPPFYLLASVWFGLGASLELLWVGILSLRELGHRRINRMKPSGNGGRPSI